MMEVEKKQKNKLIKNKGILEFSLKSSLSSDKSSQPNFVTEYIFLFEDKVAIITHNTVQFSNNKKKNPIKVQSQKVKIESPPKFKAITSKTLY